MNENDILTEYYTNHCDEDARTRSRHGMVEFLTTMRYIQKYLKPGARVLEVGAGTGRYSHTLARQGWQVDAVELVAHNIEIFQRSTLPGEPVSIRQGNALDLEGLEDGTYDITLLLGPMYHLYTIEEQKKALTEALRVTKSGGVLFAAYCGNDATVLQCCFGKAFLKDPHYQALTDPDTFKLASTPEEVFALHRKEDIDTLMESLPAERLHFVGTDMATGYQAQMVDSLDDELFQLYLRWHYCICERPDMVGVSNHFLDVSRKT